MAKKVSKGGKMVTSSSSNDSNLWGAISYLGMPLTSVITLLAKPNDKYIKFHSWQGILTAIGIYAVSFVLAILLGTLSAIPILGFIVGLLVGGFYWLLVLLLWLYCMWKAYSGEKFKLPIVGDFAEKQANQ